MLWLGEIIVLAGTEYIQATRVAVQALAEF
jgi:hypothetical protein